MELNATLVFDSKYFPGGSEKSNFDNLEIIFTSAGDTADQLIIEHLDSAKDPFNETVVTSDKKLAWYARRCSAKTISVEEFIDWLNRRFRNKLKQQKNETKDEKYPQVFKKVKIRVEDGSEEYYLKAFEEEFKKIEEETPKIKKTPISKIKAAKEEKISDFERWLKAFESKLSEGTDSGNGA